MEYIPKYIDFDYINEVTDGDKDAIIKILNLFVNQVNEITKELLNAIQDKDNQKMRFFAHKAKNDLIVVGMKSLSVKMNELEVLAKKEENSILFAQITSLYIKETQLAIIEIHEIINMNYLQ